MDNITEHSDRRQYKSRQRTELFFFLFLGMALIPAVTVAGVGAYGLLIWLLQ